MRDEDIEEENNPFRADTIINVYVGFHRQTEVKVEKEIPSNPFELFK